MYNILPYHPHQNYCEKNNLAGVSPTVYWHFTGTQVYAPVLNENVFTNLWGENFDGYSRVIESFELLGYPRRLKPASIYYHMYSGTYPASLKALQDVYQWTKKQKLTPLYLSEYAERAKTLYETALSKNFEGDWIVTSSGVKSVRLPKEYSEPNLDNSNIAGWSVSNDGTYIPLTKTRTKLNFEPAILNSKSIRLDNSNGKLVKWEKQGRIINWSIEAHQPLELVIANAKNCILESEFDLQLKKEKAHLKFYQSKDKGRIFGQIICAS